MNRTIPMLMLFLFAVTACGPTQTPTPGEATSQAGIANPASVFCEANGGRLEIRTGSDGGQIGVCIFPDESECEEWAYFRAECKPRNALGTPAAAASDAPATVEPVALQVLSPQDEALVSEAQIQVVGTSSPDAVVTVNDEILIAGSDGSFETTVTLEEGVNLIEVVASNASGTEAYVDLVVTYQP